MDNAKCNALLAAIDAGSITAAAEKLGYTQSGLSYTIAAAETELGFPLLDRSRSGVRPTAACRQLLPLLRELERKNALLEQEASDIRGLVRGELVLGIFPSISRAWLPELLKRFEQRHPGVTVRMQEGGHAECSRWLHSGEVELALFSRQRNDGWEWLEVGRDEILAVLPATHPLAGEKALSLQQVSEDPFILLSQDYDFDVPNVLKELGFQPNIRFISKDELSILAMVREGLGVSVMAALFLHDPPPGISVLPLRPRAYRTLGVAFSSREALSPAARRFLELARQALPLPAPSVP